MFDEPRHRNNVTVERLAGVGRYYELSDLDGDRVTVVTHRGRIDLVIRSRDGSRTKVVARLSDEQARLLALTLCRVYEHSAGEPRRPRVTDVSASRARLRPVAEHRAQGRADDSDRDDIGDRREQRGSPAKGARHAPLMASLTQW